MTHSDATGLQRRAEDLVCWTRGERLRFLWYRLCLTVQQIVYANGRMIEREIGLTPPDPAPRAAPGRPGASDGAHEIAAQHDPRLRPPE
jgi:hypothetical protein